MTATFSLVLNHAPWRMDRARCASEMLQEILPLSSRIPFLLNDRDFRGQDWQQAKVAWALDHWRWSVKQETDWHLFMTDDLALAPGFVDLARAIFRACDGESAIGFLANHPRISLATLPGRFYRTNSWIVGPCYALSHEALGAFLPYFEALPDGSHETEGTKAYRNDDSSVNDWITRSGRSTVHPCPTIIEHRLEVASTTGHGDRYSLERMSWRFERWVVEGDGGSFAWAARPKNWPLGAMKESGWWGDPKTAALLPVGE